MFKQIGEVIRLAVETRTPVLLWGPRGVGKTQYAKQVIGELGYDFRIVRTAGKEDTDFSGIPVEIDQRTIYASPDWMPFEEWKCKKCGHKFGEPFSNKPSKCPKCNSTKIDYNKVVILFDEVNRGSDETLQALLEFVADKSFDGRPFASRTSIIATANPAGGSSYIVNAFDDEAFLSRWAHISFGVDKNYFDEWYQYLLQNVDPEVVQKAIMYIGEDRDKLIGPTESDWGFTVKPAPRSWEWALKVMSYGKAHGYSKNAILDLMSGLLGRGIAGEFYRTDIKVQASEVIHEWSTKEGKLCKIIDKFNRAEVASLCMSVTSTALSIKIKKSERENVRNFLLYIASKKGSNRDLVAASLQKFIASEYPTSVQILYNHDLRDAVSKAAEKEAKSTVKPWTKMILGDKELSKFAKNTFTKDVLKD